MELNHYLLSFPSKAVISVNTRMLIYCAALDRRGSKLKISHNPSVPLPHLESFSVHFSWVFILLLTLVV